MVGRLDKLPSDAVLRWGCPVPYFGALRTARVATVGLNPSNREFVDVDGVELEAHARRLPTLHSLGIDRWDDADALHLKQVLESCDDYFAGNPYDVWFRVLDFILFGAGHSYYGPTSSACHLDLVPYATLVKWGNLPAYDRGELLRSGGEVLARFLRESSVDLLILNGRSVVLAFQALIPDTLSPEAVAEWTLPRRAGAGVEGVAYRGWVGSIAGVDLGRSIKVIGYNHNLQSSYGVTSGVLRAIQDWVGAEWAGAIE